MSRYATLTLTLSILAVCSAPIAAQHAESAPSPTEADWSTQNLGAAINSPYHDAFPTISRDGLVLYFASDRASYAGGDSLCPWYDTSFDIYVARRESLASPWPAPRRLPSHINTEGEDHSVSLSPDGHWLYFSSDSLSGCGKLDIFRAYREDVNDDLGWGEPENLGCEVNGPESDVCVIYHADENDDSASLYFVSRREGGLGSMDIYESPLDPTSGQFGLPVLVEEVSSTALDGHFDPDAGFVWTMRDGGAGGSDIWHSTRSASGTWEPPVNVGALNTEYEEQMPSPFDHGRVLFFLSDRPNGSGGLDLYVSERS